MDQAHFNMVEQQIRPWEVLDPRVLDVFAQIPRADFVSDKYRGLAYADLQIPLGHQQSMMPPKVEARMLQALNIKPSERILEIGTGSAYVTALMAKLGHHVFSVDIFPEFIHNGAQLLKRHHIENVTLEVGDAAQGWKANGPYDVIAVTGSLPIYTPVFESLLKENGRLFVVTGVAPVMEAWLLTRTGTNQYAKEILFETVLAPLINVPQPEAFVF